MINQELLEAASDGDLDSVKLLLANENIDVNYKDVLIPKH